MDHLDMHTVDLYTQHYRYLKKNMWMISVHKTKTHKKLFVNLRKHKKQLMRG